MVFVPSLVLADAMEVDPPRSGYQPKRALFCAIEDWIPEFYKPKGKLFLHCIYISAIYLSVMNSI